MEKITDALIGESYYRIDHPSGLTVFLYPKEDFSKTYAIFGAKFGSIDRQFAVNGGERMVLPDGIAHFLEHKLFEDEDGDAFEKYAKTGACLLYTSACRRGGDFSAIHRASWDDGVLKTPLDPAAAIRIPLTLEDLSLIHI